MKKLHLFLLAAVFLMGIVWNIQADNFAVEFFGSGNDRVTAPDSDSLDISGKDFTMEAWVFSKGGGIIVNKENSYEMQIHPLAWAIAAPTWAFFGNAIVASNEWVHIAVTYDGETSIGWVNGKKASEDKTNKGNIIPQDGDGSPFSVGWRPYGDHTPFTGIIDEVRVSSVVRYTKKFEVPEEEFKPDNDTRVLYHFNKGKEKKIKDFSKNKNDAELIGGVEWVKSDVPIKTYLAASPLGRLTTTWGLIKRQ